MPPRKKASKSKSYEREEESPDPLDFDSPPVASTPAPSSRRPLASTSALATMPSSANRSQHSSQGNRGGSYGEMDSELDDEEEEEEDVKPRIKREPEEQRSAPSSSSRTPHRPQYGKAGKKAAAEARAAATSTPISVSMSMFSPTPANQDSGPASGSGSGHSLTPPQWSPSEAEGSGRGLGQAGKGRARNGNSISPSHRPVGRSSLANLLNEPTPAMETRPRTSPKLSVQIQPPPKTPSPVSSPLTEPEPVAEFDVEVEAEVEIEELPEQEQEQLRADTPDLAPPSQPLVTEEDNLTVEDLPPPPTTSSAPHSPPPASSSNPQQTTHISPVALSRLMNPTHTPIPETVPPPITPIVSGSGSGTMISPTSKSSVVTPGLSVEPIHPFSSTSMTARSESSFLPTPMDQEQDLGGFSGVGPVGGRLFITELVGSDEGRVKEKEVTEEVILPSTTLVSAEDEPMKLDPTLVAPSSDAALSVDLNMEQPIAGPSVTAVSITMERQESGSSTNSSNLEGGNTSATSSTPAKTKGKPTGRKRKAEVHDPLANVGRRLPPGMTQSKLLERLLSAKYNDKGELIEDEPEAGGSSSKDVVMAEPQPSTMDSAITTARRNSKGSSPIKEASISIVPSIASRAEMRRLQNAKYNEKGEIIEDGDVFQTQTPSGSPQKMVSPPQQPQQKPAKVPKKVKASKEATPLFSNTPGFQPLPPAPPAAPVAASAPAAAFEDILPEQPLPSQKKGKGKAKAVVVVDEMDITRESSAAEEEPVVKAGKGKKGKKVEQARSPSVASSLPDSRSVDSAPPPKKSGKSSKLARAISLEPEPEPEPPAPVELYCLCRQPYDEDDENITMVACEKAGEKCGLWFHIACININRDDLDLLDLYICADCEKETPTRTTWLTKCKREECRFPARLPLSKYCSESCGLHHVLGAMKSKGVHEDDIMDIVMFSCKPQGYSIQETGSSSSTTKIEPQRNRAKATQEFKISQLHRQISSIQQRLSQNSATLEQCTDRERQLDKAVAYAEKIKPVIREAEALGADAPAKKGKKPSRPAGPVEEFVCGFDERLLFPIIEDTTVEEDVQDVQEVQDVQMDLEEDQKEDEKKSTVVERTVNVEDTSPYICRSTEKKCKRHIDWQLTRQEALMNSRNHFDKQKGELEADLRKCVSRVRSLGGDVSPDISGLMRTEVLVHMDTA